MKFTDFNFKDYINQTLENIKFEKPTEVQEKLIPIVLVLQLVFQIGYSLTFG